MSIQKTKKNSVIRLWRYSHLSVLESRRTGPIKIFEVSNLALFFAIQFHFRTITGNITLSNTDGFRGESVKVASSDGSILQCAIDGWIDGDNTIPNENNVPKYQEFSCSYQSKYNMGYVSQGNECKVILL